MEKPICPKKPKQSDKPPAKHYIEYFSLIDAENGQKTFRSETDNEFRIKNDSFYGHISFKEMIEISEKIGTTNFTIAPDMSGDLFVRFEKENPNYSQELADFEKRFETFEDLFKKYVIDLKKYENFEKQKQIAQKRLEIENLQKELTND